MMQKAPNRKKLRRRYLARKSCGNALVAIGNVLKWGGLPLLWLIVYLVNPKLVSGNPYALLLLMALVIPGALIEVYGKALLKTGRKWRDTDYVPPVTPDTLPAEEILMRGAKLPSPEPGRTLLRATQTVETADEELLRVE